MRRTLVGILGLAAVLSLVGVAASQRFAPRAAAAPAASQEQSLCIGHHPQDFVWYSHSCTGHDEPELDPISDHSGSAQDITWTVLLPSNGAAQVDSVGPTFWIGGVVNDPTSLNSQAFLELQFYPNSLLNGCSVGGGYNVKYDPGVYTVCSPVWKVSINGKIESAAFNAMLTDDATGGPLVMHQGDTITDHQYITPAADGMHITVTDLTTGHSGTIVLNSKTDGPLMPAYKTQQIGNALAWGLVEEVHPRALLFAAVEDLLDKLLEAEPRAVQIQKALIRQWEDLPTTAAIAAGVDAFEDAWTTDEPSQSLARFVAARQAARKR